VSIPPVEGPASPQSPNVITAQSIATGTDPGRLARWWVMRDSNPRHLRCERTCPFAKPTRLAKERFVNGSSNRFGRQNRTKTGSMNRRALRTLSGTRTTQIS